MPGGGWACLRPLRCYVQPINPHPPVETSRSFGLFGLVVFPLIHTNQCSSASCFTLLKRLNELREAKSQPGLRLRLTVEGGGCSGFQYKFALEDAAAAAAEAAKEGDAHDDSDDEDGGDVDQ